ncbi:MerR family transcriptional regulator [Lentzea sp. NPDC006480]|uniref:MerR family transcriptional regulator n=1 Tax=Lentzea sp. NPDC006480 TaxID=3157176 RepID=UPI0033BEAAF9
MLIGELSRRTGVAAHLLRYYESQGLLEPERGSSGYREYAQEAVLAVVQIRKLLDAGLSTQEIRYLLPCATGAGPELEPCAELLDVLRARLEEMDRRIETLTRSRDALRTYVSDTERSAEQAPCVTVDI